METLRSAPSYDLNSAENRAARDLFSNTIAQAGRPSETTSRPYPSSSTTSTGGSATAARPKSVWDILCASGSEDEEDRPAHLAASGSAAIPPPAAAAAAAAAAIAPPSGSAAVPAVAVDVAANDSEDSDADFIRFLPTVKRADLPSPSTRPSTTRGSPVPATTSGDPATPNGSNGASGTSNGGRSRSPCGNAGKGKKRRREGSDGAACADRTPPPPRRTDVASDSDSGDSDSRSSGGDQLDALRKATGHRRSKVLGSRHQCNHDAPCGGSSRGPSLSGAGGGDGDDDNDGRVRSDSDPDCKHVSGGSCSGRGFAPAPGCRRTKRGGTDGMQVEFDSDSDFDPESDFGGGAASAGKRGGRHEAVIEEEGDDDDEYDDGDEEEWKPTLSHAPFTDTETRPLVLTNEAGGQRAEVPASVNRYLKNYQKEGVEFMYRLVRHAMGPKGAILADDMGLGKTVQVIALLLALLKKKGTGRDLKDLRTRRKRKQHVSAAGKPVLIVCPTSVRRSWEKHLDKWGHFASRSILTRTANAGRGALQSVESLLKADRLEVVVVGETMFKNSIDILKKFDWLAVVFDEVHGYKNPSTKLAQAVNEMEKAEVFIGLTGTLVQNKLSEVWTVMNMIQPGCLKTLDHFKAHFERPILEGRKNGASRADCKLAAERLREFFPLRDKVVLRREKSILGDLLKGKIGTVVFCDLTEVQRIIYRTVLALPEFRLLATANEPCPCGRVDAKSGSCCGEFPKDESSEDLINPKALIWRRFHPNLETCDKRPGCPYCCAFAAISKLQKLANHPCLLQVKPNRDYAGQPQKKLDDLAFAQVAFSEQALAIMTTRPGDDDGIGASAGAGGWTSTGEGGTVSGGEAWDRRLARPENFLQLCRDDTCGKMRTLKVLLKRFHNKDKVLLFSYSTAMLDILQMLCSGEGYTFLRLDGNTAKDQRSKMIERFAKQDVVDSNIFLISTKAGGTGLNLQSANKVILYDVNWNPAQDAQAEDRAYRIGQLRDVEVFRLVSTGTIEELTYMRQIYKLQISAAAMGDNSEGGLRQFEGVQGDSSQQGELWGISNLMRFSGESMLLNLRREHGAGLPPLVRDSKDGLLMEPQENMVEVLKNYAAAENSATQQGAQHPQAAVGEEVEEEEEEEFDDTAWSSGVGGSSGAGAEPATQNARTLDGGHDHGLGGVVMLHDDMVAADKVEELPPATQESVSVGINEVEMMDDDDTDDEAMDEAMDEASAAPASPAAAPPVTGDGLIAPAGSGEHGGLRAAAGTPRLVGHTFTSDDADSGDGNGNGGPVRGRAEEDQGEPAADEPSWALLPTQPPNHVREGVDEVEGVPSSLSPVVSASSPSAIDFDVDLDVGNPWGLSGGGGRTTSGGSRSIAGDGSSAAGDMASAAAAGDDTSSQRQARARAAERDQGSAVPSQFLYAPAAQDVVGVLDYTDGDEEKDANQEESKLGEDETGTGTGTGGTDRAEETHEESNAASSLALEIPLTGLTDASCEAGNAGRGAGRMERRRNDRNDGNDGKHASDPLRAGASPQQEQEGSSSELELGLSNFEDVCFSSETQPPPGLV